MEADIWLGGHRHTCLLGSKMALWNLFTPNLRPPLALFHAAQVILGVQKLGADINELDGWSTIGSACDFCTLRVLIELVQDFIDRLGRLLGPTVSNSVITCHFQGIGEDRILTRVEIRMSSGPEKGKNHRPSLRLLVPNTCAGI